MAEILDFATFLCAPAIGLALGVFLVRFAWWAWKEVNAWQVDYERAQIETDRIRADAELVVAAPGMIKMERAQLAATVREQLQLAMAQIEAGRTHAPVPTRVHYSVQYAPPALSGDGAHGAHLVEPARLPDANDSIPATAMECYAQGLFDDPSRLFVGFNENAHPVYSPLEDTFGVAVAGVPKMGKTTGMRLWAVQMALHGAQMAIVDPAANSASQQGLAADLSGLRAHLWEQPASSPDDILRMLRRIETVGTARNRGQDKSNWPLMVLIDEMTSLVTGERGDEIADMILRINRQFRKEHIFIVAAGQDWLGYALGGDAGLRRAFVCKAVYRVDVDIGRKLNVRKPLIDMVPSLQRGQMVWVDAFANQSLVSVPDCSAACVRAILGASGPSSKDFHTGNGLLTEVAGSNNGTHRSSPVVGDEVDGEVILEPGKLRQIRDYGGQGWSTHKIIGTVFGVAGGSSYGNARELVNKVLGREI